MPVQFYSFECEKACRSHKSDNGSELWNVTVRAGQLPRNFKLGPNARYAVLTNKPVKEMLDTLRSEPKSFIFKNNGIMLVSESIVVAGSHVTIRCNEPEETEDFIGHGVLNGGHTYKAITHALEQAESGQEAYAQVPADASVILTVAIGIDEDYVWRISRARNTSQSVPLHALRELAGDWSHLKKFLPKETRPLVAFKPNEPEAQNAFYNVTDLVKLLALLNNGLFPAEKNQHPISAYTGIGSLVRQYSADNFLKVAHLLPDAIKLQEWVVSGWEDLSGKGAGKVAIGKANGVSKEPVLLLSGKTLDLSLPAPFVLPVIAAFRVFVTSSGEWALPLEELWATFGQRTIIALWEAYKEQGKSSPAVFGRSRTSWAAACDLTKSAAIQMSLLKVV